MKIPEEARQILEKLHEHGYDSWIVGGWVRDTMLGKEPKDADIATVAWPPSILELFSGSKPVSALFHSVVYVPVNGKKIEVATLRKETDYTDGIRPNHVMSTGDILEDLARRDFTCNAMAISFPDGALIDPFDGELDLKNKTLRAVGSAVGRLTEHPARILRAARFSEGLSLRPDAELDAAICHLVMEGHLKRIPWETYQDELMKGLATDHPDEYILGLMEHMILGYMLPEILALLHVEQNIHHGLKDVLTHTLEAVYAASDPLVRLGVLFHDVGKPSSQKYVSEEYGFSFHRHELLGVPLAERALHRLKFDNETIGLVLAAVKYHMPSINSPRAARRFLANCGSADRARYVLEVMKADGWNRRDTGAMVELVEKAIEAGSAFKITDLAIGGEEVMKILGIDPGPDVGIVLRALLELVLHGPETNTEEYLAEMVGFCKFIIPTMRRVRDDPLSCRPLPDSCDEWTTKERERAHSNPHYLWTTEEGS